MKYQTDFPEHCSTRYSLRVRFVETDLMGIVHHAAYLSYVEAARVEYLRRRGADYRALVSSGLHMPVVEARLAYKRAARFDDALDVEVRLGALSRVTVRFDYRVLLADADSALLAEGFTLLACVDATHKPRRLPDEIVALLQRPESPPSR